ncbi:MAG: hypothetical protein Q7U66_07330 [Methylobacter sp.]|nr:hypothetical protein [Methylobacter sp.]MDO9047533.1 hypothetical protein [Methylobacter sp.]
MANLKSRLLTLERIANPEKPWFTIEVNGEPTPEQWTEINAAHADRREVYVFQTLGDTLGVWLVGADDIYWSDNG